MIAALLRFFSSEVVIKDERTHTDDRDSRQAPIQERGGQDSTGAHERAPPGGGRLLRPQHGEGPRLRRPFRPHRGQGVRRLHLRGRDAFRPPPRPRPVQAPAGRHHRPQRAERHAPGRLRGPRLHPGLRRLRRPRHDGGQLLNREGLGEGCRPRLAPTFPGHLPPAVNRRK